MFCWNILSETQLKQELSKRYKVLILVLLEYTLGVRTTSFFNENGKSLNPCFVGIYSRSDEYSQDAAYVRVLILVLLEYTLGDKYDDSKYLRCYVLILVLLEYTLGESM